MSQLSSVASVATAGLGLYSQLRQHQQQRRQREAADAQDAARREQAQRLRADALNRTIASARARAGASGIGAGGGSTDALIAADPSAGRMRRQRLDRPALERARDYLDSDLEAPAASDALERLTGLDRFALARQFRAAFGTSPYHYVVMRRLGRARALLALGTALAEVAAACGFADQSHLTRQFHRAYGVTPGRWRALQNRPDAMR